MISANPATGDAAAVGQEIRQALQQQQIKESRCVVALPLSSVLTLQTKIPPIPESDVAEFLDLEAERNFAYDPGSLFISSDRAALPSGEKIATIVGAPRGHVEPLLAALRAARLKPLSVTLGISALQQMFGAERAPQLFLVLSDEATEVAVSSGGGLIATRSLDTSESASAEAIARELRVTLGQLPAEARARLVIARMFGANEQISRARTELAPRLRPLGLEIETPEQASLGSDAPPAAAVAAEYLSGRKARYEFLPPKTSSWKKFVGKTSSRKLAWAAGIAAAVLLLFLGAFLVQGWQLSKLQNRWSVMAPRVTELEAMQQQIKRFRPWFDNSFRSLTILRKLTEAFPVDGVVTAKTLEIRNQTQVICSGVARDNQSLFTMLDQLRGTKEVADVKMDQIRGKNPLQFSFNFRWVEGGTGEH